ncbi:MAG TPA: hydantoinase B/oxoprolinase family protein [Candidatus Thermoplasmatota archaeon]
MGRTGGATTELSPATLAVIRATLEATCEEMGGSLQRSAFSPNIKERRDFSCALFDADGRLVAQAEHIPVHLGSMEASVAATLLELGALKRGDTAVCNDPYRGGTHVPDVTMITPVLAGNRLLGYAANRAHHADMGGIAPGSMPAGATRVDEEGVIISPSLLYNNDRLVKATHDKLKETRNVPERVADFRAQRAACMTGVARVNEIAKRRGPRILADAFDTILERSRIWLEDKIDVIPSGVWRAEDALDDDGFAPGQVPLKVRVERRGKRLIVDYEGSSSQRRGNVNAPLAVTCSASYYVVKLLVDPLIPSNHGLFEPVDVQAPEGSVLNPRSPAAVSAGNVETSSRVVDVMLAALAPALPDRVPAMSQGTMNNTTIGGTSKTRPWAYYETVAGGEGATPVRAGMSGVHTHMTNTLNTPVEALEHAYPLRVQAYTIRRASGGDGLHRGGDGIIRELQILEEGVVSLLTDRRLSSPRGLAGGMDGKPGVNESGAPGRRELLPSKVTKTMPAGTRLRIETPGGGGWGRKPLSGAA